MSAIRAISAAYISKKIPTALAKKMSLQFDFFSSFSNSLMNIMKNLGLIRQPYLTPNLQRKKSVILWFILTAASTRSYILLIILRSLPCDPF